MEVILLDDVHNLGRRGEEVRVKPGYARNYLLPQGKALTASAANRAYFQQQRKKIDARLAAEREDATRIAGQIANVRVVLKRRVGESETLYGSVTASDIAEQLEAKGISIDRRKLELPDGGPIKNLGDHKVGIHLHPEVTAELVVSVEPEE